MAHITAQSKFLNWSISLALGLALGFSMFFDFFNRKQEGIFDRVANKQLRAPHISAITLASQKIFDVF